MFLEIFLIITGTSAFAVFLFLLQRLLKNNTFFKKVNPIPPQTRESLLHRLGDSKVPKEKTDQILCDWKEKYMGLKQRLKKHSDRNEAIAIPEKEITSGDLDGAEKLLKSRLENYVIPKQEGSLHSTGSSDRKFYFPPYHSLLTRLGLKKNNTRSVWHYVQQIQGVSRKKIAERVYELGLIQELKHDYQNALSSYEKAVSYDPDTSLYLYQLGGIYAILGNCKKAVIYYKKALGSDLKSYLEAYSRVNPSETNDTATENCNKMVTYYEKYMEPASKVYGEGNEYLAVHWNNLGMACESLGEYEKAIEHYQKALVLLLNVFGKEHPCVPNAWSNLGKAFKKLGQYEKAIEHYQKAMAINQETYWGDHPSVAGDWNNIGEAWQAAGRHERASEYFRKALDVFENEFGKAHPLTKRTAENLKASAN